MTAFWYVVTAFGLIAAIINFSIAALNRQHALVALVRGLAGVVSLLLAVWVVVGKVVLQWHPPFALEWQTVIIATGGFVFAVLLLPSYVDQGQKDQAQPTIQQRAARPANATVRLQNGTDEWVN